MVAAQKGASAVLIRSIGTSDDRIAHTGLMRYDDAVQKIPAAALANPDADLLQRMLKRPAPVDLQLFLDVGYTGEYTSHNVIGDLRGTVKPDEYVVIGCHLDSWDHGTGAIDDGAGCAITMAAATLIARSGEKPRRSSGIRLATTQPPALNSDL